MLAAGRTALVASLTLVVSTAGAAEPQSDAPVAPAAATPVAPAAPSVETAPPAPAPPPAASDAGAANAGPASTTLAAAGPGVAPAASDAVRATPLGYVEVYYAYNFARPGNGVTNARGFDNRHNSFTLSNAALGASFAGGPLEGRVVLQVGALPSTVYAAEPVAPGASAANASSGELWKYLQEAWLTARAPVGRGLKLQAGIAPSPIGYEVLPVKDNWNWSRSNLFFGLPFYHTGLRATQELSEMFSVAVGVFNGWNSVVDNNEAKSVQASLAMKREDGDQKLTAQLLYFGGIERTDGAPEGPVWRHHVDALAEFVATKRVAFAVQGDAGFEETRMGAARWFAAAGYARLMPVERVYVALRGDRFVEHLATGAAGVSTPLFWGGVEWVSSLTATLEARPHDNLAVRLEGRHDAAEAPLFFRGPVAGAGTAAAPYVASSRTQTTLLLGGTAWF